MKLSSKTRHLHIFSFLKSMSNLLKIPKKKHYLQPLGVSPQPSINEVKFHNFFDVHNVNLPKHMYVNIMYNDDPIDALKHIKVDFTLVEVDESKITIEIVLTSLEQVQLLNSNLNALLKASLDVIIEENEHVNY